MRHSALPGDARLHSRPGEPSKQVLRSGLHELAEPPSSGRGGATRPSEPLLVVPPSVAPDNPLLIFFHGAGGAASTSLPLVRSAAAEHGCLVLLLTSAAHTWDVITGGWGSDVDRLDAVLEAVFDHFAVQRFAFGGFSDGASYALSIGLANGDLADTVLAFSPGFAVPPDRIGRPRIWISHGTQDTVLPIDRCARPIARTLRGAGYELNYEEFDGPHVVPPDTVDRALRWWLDQP